MKYEHQLRKLSSEERKNLSSEELFHSAEFSSYLQKMGETLLRHCGITKRLSLTILPTGIAPGWTDGKKEYLVPENTITEAYNDIYAKFTALLGIHFHEIAHIIYCDFAEEQKAIDKIKIFQGDLLAFDGETLTIDYLDKTRHKTVEIPYQTVAKARLAVKL